MGIPLNDNTTTPKSAESARARSVSGGRDARKQYRVNKHTGGQMQVVLHVDGKPRATGECADLSIGGVGVSLPRTKDPELVEGTQLRVTIQHLGRAKGIDAAAEIVTVAQVGQGVRYGLRFLNVAEVVQQVDSFYARWFNRRRHVRVMPDFATKLSGDVKWSDGELSARIHDLSMGGVGILATLDQVAALKDKSRVEIALTLPGTPLPITCRAKVVGMKSFTKNVLIGLEFEPNGGIERYTAALQRYIDERQRSIAKFNEAMAQMPKRAG